MLNATAGPYVPQPTVEKSIIAFFNVNKYPPSLQFLLMTLGPSLMLLAWFDRLDLSAPKNWFWRKILVFGQVPMFYYILHIWLIHVFGAGHRDGARAVLRMAAERRYLRRRRAE